MKPSYWRWISCLFFLSAGVFGAAPAVTSQATSSDEPSVAGLIAVASLDNSGILRVTLRNVSGKAITAYRLRWSGGNVTEYSQELIQSLVPSTGTQALPAGGELSLGNDPFGPYTKPREGKVVGVVYDDNSWEGELHFAELTFGVRRNHASAIERELPILKSGQGVCQVAEQLRMAALNGASRPHRA